MDQYIENKDYIESLFGPLEKQCNVNKYYINGLFKQQQELTESNKQLKQQVLELQQQQQQIIVWNNLPWYKKIFKKF